MTIYYSFLNAKSIEEIMTIQSQGSQKKSSLGPVAPLIGYNLLAQSQVPDILKSLSISKS